MTVRNFINTYQKDQNKKMNKWIAIILLLFLTGTNSCKSKTVCYCSRKTVCVSLINSSGQLLENLRLESHKVNETSIKQLAPNDKTCLEGSVITPTLIGQYVHYTIRFENTGTFSLPKIL